MTNEQVVLVMRCINGQQISFKDVSSTEDSGLLWTFFYKLDDFYWVTSITEGRMRSCWVYRPLPKAMEAI